MHHCRIKRHGNHATTFRRTVVYGEDQDGSSRLSAYTKVLPNGCWEWQGSKRRDGYGYITVHSATLPNNSSPNSHTSIGAHRLAYILHKGPISDGLFVCHACDNKLCINPAHLWLGAPKDNTLDAASKGRMASNANGNWRRNRNQIKL